MNMNTDNDKRQKKIKVKWKHVQLTGREKETNKLYVTLYELVYANVVGIKSC